MESVSESRRTSLASLGNMETADVSRLGYNRGFGGLVQGLFAKLRLQGRIDKSVIESRKMIFIDEQRSGEFDGH